MIVVLVFLAALALFGPRFGADTRDGGDWAENRPFAGRRHVADETGRGDPGDVHAAEPEEYAHERERAGHSPAYC
ncbi:hypothetical protein [Actinocorallia sp. A-T 12471]|uniref:hypothetical protein n=1 Tax=Actinocorallia sp. A-T 12471 TaxID=3089813 RepID=UPI0029D32353|nr:hypothetical protein [Actinocorallia sp. A-T 12471]MDX6741397.1 hypothetical protein [Actinocorallia sp. A-T 12471]